MKTTTEKPTENEETKPNNVSATEKLSEAKAEVAPSGPTKTPDAWAKELGNFKAGNPFIPQVSENYSLAHSAADRLHGWSEHAYQFQAESDALLITREDYEAALAAALKFPTVAPHGPALSRLKAKQFENFTPARSRR